MSDKERLQKDAGLAHPPTDLTYELRMAISGHRADEFLSWGYQWTDKPHRLVFAACGEAEALAAENERLRAALEQDKPRAAWADAIAKNGLLCEQMERLRKLLWEVNEQCPEHVPIYLLNEIRAILNKEPRT